MINTYNLRKFCKDDISKIDNYEEAVQSDDIYDCHHRLELTLEGEYAHSKEDLIRMDMYYHRPYYELILLPHKEHTKLHRKFNSCFSGHKLSKEMKDKLINSHKGKVHWNKGLKLNRR